MRMTERRTEGAAIAKSGTQSMVSRGYEVIAWHKQRLAKLLTDGGYTEHQKEMLTALFDSLCTNAEDFFKEAITWQDVRDEVDELERQSQTKERVPLNGISLN